MSDPDAQGTEQTRPAHTHAGTAHSRPAHTHAGTQPAGDENASARPRARTPRSRDTGGQGRVRAVRLGGRSAIALVLVSVIGVAAFGWPLLAAPSSGLAHSGDAPWLFAALLPLLLAVAVATISDNAAGSAEADNSRGGARGRDRTRGLDAKSVAMLGVLAAAGAALRPLGAGTAGIEPMFFLMVLSGRVLGPGFGFVLGSVAMFASALLTGGVGPWMPFQMLSMGWVAMGAGLLPGARRLRGRAELVLLAGYGAVASVLYGTVMNLQGWPYLGGMAASVSFVPGDPLSENLTRFAAYCLATSLGWDLPRAAVTVVLTLTLGGSVLRALRRATRRAAFDAPVSFRP
ncbi:ECF transporter S component [Streptomyces palmae]|uniref:ECF transporter S component n=1 Tax=Streptomyces palmae TaxID=1701085 RepID=A0A4Z0HAA4_9ACTN|nr:ECF transporter S component [Streptomyces palmae]TGB07912.1 ECF transporter S component [Streptomyces palmae]